MITSKNKKNIRNKIIQFFMSKFSKDSILNVKCLIFLYEQEKSHWDEKGV